jgi:ABC-2 type transport system permease protein
MREIIRAALVIARRDYVATVWSKTFLLFLIGPLFPILFGVVFGSVGASIDREASRPTVAVAAEGKVAKQIADARIRLAARIGDKALPDIHIIPPRDDPAALLADKSANVTAVLSGGLDHPTLTGPPGVLDDLNGGLALILDEARQGRALGSATPRPVMIARHATQSSVGADNGGRLLTARTSQLVLLMLTMILAGMLLSNLIEEKSNKIIEVLAAAVPVDAIFLGKLVAMLGMSLTGIAVWGGTAALAVLLLFPQAIGAFPVPAVGWPTFAVFGVVYFTATYLLLGAVFLGIGGQASTVREVQTLSMPVTMGQLVVFAFASSSVGDPSGGLALSAAIFPWSSPFAMLARAAQMPALWPHLLAIGWQALWVALTIRFAARRFRISVLKSGGRQGFFRRRARIARNHGIYPPDRQESAE